MAFGFTGKSFALLRLNLGPKAVMSAAFLIAVNTALVVGAGYWSLSRDFDTRALRDIDANLRTLSLAFGETFPNAKIVIRDGVVVYPPVDRTAERVFENWGISLAYNSAYNVLKEFYPDFLRIVFKRHREQDPASTAPASPPAPGTTGAPRPN